MKIAGKRRIATKALLLHDERGASAVEFSLLASVLAFACLAAADCGLAISEKIALDYSLRVAAEGAVADLGEDDVDDLLRAVASEHFTIAESNSDLESKTNLVTKVERFCACPDSVSTAVDCSAAGCPSTTKPYIYYRLSVEKEYAAIFLPQFSLAGSLLVQIE